MSGLSVVLSKIMSMYFDTSLKTSRVEKLRGDMFREERARRKKNQGKV
jgi:hypothetical protein